MDCIYLQKPGMDNIRKYSKPEALQQEVWYYRTLLRIRRIVKVTNEDVVGILREMTVYG